MEVEESSGEEGEGLREVMREEEGEGGVTGKFEREGEEVGGGGKDEGEGGKDKGEGMDGGGGQRGRMLALEFHHKEIPPVSVDATIMFTL